MIAVANTGDLIRHGTDLFKVEKEAARDFFRTMEIQSSAAAVENLLLAATSLGLGTVWLGVLYLIKVEVLRFLGEPEGEFMAVVPVGRPVQGRQRAEKAAARDESSHARVEASVAVPVQPCEVVFESMGRRSHLKR